MLIFWAVESNRSWSQAELEQISVIQLSRIGVMDVFALMAGRRAETPRHSTNGEVASERTVDRHSAESLHVSVVIHS
jgi:hypothetical protein